jgi:gamma-glutamyltranspeptidase
MDRPGSGGGRSAWYRERNIAAIPDDSAHSVTIPAVVDAWCRLHERFGRLDFGS